MTSTFARINIHELFGHSDVGESGFAGRPLKYQSTYLEKHRGKLKHEREWGRKSTKKASCEFSPGVLSKPRSDLRL